MVKLVRDRIPEIIRRESGSEPEVYRASVAEYRQRLREKLGEEVQEFLAEEEPDAALEELADVLEVLHALAADLGADPEKLRKTAELGV